MFPRQANSVDKHRASFVHERADGGLIHRIQRIEDLGHDNQFVSRYVVSFDSFSNDLFATSIGVYISLDVSMSGFGLEATSDVAQRFHSSKLTVSHVLMPFFHAYSNNGIASSFSRSHGCHLRSPKMAQPSTILDT